VRVLAGDASPALLPALPEPGQKVIISMPCWLCGKPHDYTTMTITRIGPCCRAMQDQLRGADQATHA